MLTLTRILFLACVISLLALGTAAQASDPVLSPTVIGERSVTTTTVGETLMDVARREGLGFGNLVDANPRIDPWLPPAGAEITLPGQVILPAGAGDGLTINLAEMRLFHIRHDGKARQIEVYPLGIGREGRDTPEGIYHVVTKKEAPIWRVPEGLRETDPTLPELVPPGPDNPLGAFWLGLSAPGYGIHGTNRPLGVGRRVSYGCIRMYPEHIAGLFQKVPVGSAVRIVYQPVKAGWHGDILLLEVHPDYLARHADLFQEALRVVGRVAGAAEIDYSKVRDVVARQSGLPEVIGRRPDYERGQN